MKTAYLSILLLAAALWAFGYIITMAVSCTFTDHIATPRTWCLLCRIFCKPKAVPNPK